MAHRCRQCSQLSPIDRTTTEPRPDMPVPTKLAELEPLMGTLMDCAAAYDAIDPEPTTIVEWVRWLDVDVRAAAGFQVGRRQPRRPMAGPQK
jgi:hypothetical protein